MQQPTLKNESLLVRNLSKGDHLAFNTLFKAYSGRLYRFALGYYKSDIDAEELVQEVFTIIWVKRASLKEELSFKSFLFTIAFNIIRKHFRTKSYLAQYLKDGKISDLDMQTTQQVNYDSLYQYITQLVDALPARRKEIFIKSRFNGMNIDEISVELKISHKTVENQLTDALRFVRMNLIRENMAVMIFLILIIS